MTRRTHLEVPAGSPVADCLGPKGSAGVTATVIAMLQGRWKLPILFRLFMHPVMRFSEIQHDIEGISHKMLTQHLRELEADRLVSRADYGRQPPRVEYRLSRRGEALRAPLIGLRDFARRPDGPDVPPPDASPR